MSHFTVMVIGPDPEAQLAPYHEYECTGENDEYVQDIDITDKVRADIGKQDRETLLETLKWHGLIDKIVAYENLADKDGEHRYGYAVVREGELIKAVDRTNPNAKWDWYTLGGRWTGYFKATPGAGGVTVGKPGLMTDEALPGRADQLRKDQIDIEGMRDEAAQQATTRWTKFFALLGNDPLPPSWEEFRKRYPVIEDAREAYSALPGVSRINQSRDYVFCDYGKEFAGTEEQYLQRARNGAIVTFAVVHDGKWYESGSMGWWGAVADRKEPDDWHKQISALFDSLPGDTLISVYDCHI